MNDHGVKHLEMIQGVISRLAGDSFMLKGWSITLVTGLLALSAGGTNERYAILALFPALCFWGLDAYYLRQEKLFRALHGRVAQQFRAPEEEGHEILAFQLDTSHVGTEVMPWRAFLWSPTIIGLHGPVLASVVAVTIAVAIR